MNGELIAPMPSPDADLVGDVLANIIFWAEYIYETIFLVRLMLGYGWVDGIFFGASLVIYSLLTLVSVPIAQLYVNCPQKLKPHFFKTSQFLEK